MATITNKQCPPKEEAKSNKTAKQSETSLSSDSKNAICSKEKKKNGSTRIVVKYDVGFTNQLYIRGEGANLNWEKGQPLKNVKADEWVWETDQPFCQCKFKVLVNDRIYECGENHLVTAGASMQYTPHFQK